MVFVQGNIHFTYVMGMTDENDRVKLAQDSRFVYQSRLDEYEFTGPGYFCDVPYVKSILTEMGIRSMTAFLNAQGWKSYCKFHQSWHPHTWDTRVGVCLRKEYDHATM